MDGRLDWAATNRESPGRSSLLGSLAALSCEALSPLLESTFGACETVFLELANNASSTYDEQRLLEFRRELTSKKSAVMADFAARITADFNRLRQPQCGDPPSAAGSLELVAQEQIEKQLLVAGGVSRVRNEWRAALEQLHERMLAIAPREFSTQDNPLDPGRIAQTFLGACEQLETDMKCLQLLCRQFDVHVLGHLDGFYRNSNQVLIDARVLPELAAVQARQRQRAQVAERSPELSSAQAREGSHPADRPVGMPGGEAAGDGGTWVGTAGPVGASMNAGTEFSELSGLLHRVRGGTKPLLFAAGVPMPGEEGSTPISGSQLVAMISDVEAETGWLDAASRPPADIRGAIGMIAGSRGRLSLDAVEGDTLDIVTLIFDTIAQDRDLPLEIQALISRLQLPILKIALLDRGFFGDRDHPARRLINAIARAGKGWDSHNADAQDSLLDQMTGLVEGLAANGTADTGAFATALEQLTECIELAELRAVKIERRTSEKAVADRRLAAARDTVHEVMKQRLEGAELPVAVLDFFASDWQRVLQLLYLRKGTDSAEWSDAVSLMEDLVRSVAAPAVARGALAQGLPELYQRLETALALTQSHTEEAQARVDVIRDVHRKLLLPPVQGPAAPVVPIERARIRPPPMIPPRNPAPAPESEPVVEPPPGVLMFESLERVDKMPIGTWFEYTDKKSGTARRCKLSVRVDDTRMFLFCDRQGRLVREQPRKVFAYALQSGEWRVIEESALIERTMERIAGNLRLQAGAA
jgi:hypothetical protein